MIKELINVIVELLSRKPIGPGDLEIPDPTADEMYAIRPDPFEPAVSLILKHEGGFSNHPKDPGGATNMGITQKTLDSFNRRFPGCGFPSSVRDLKVEQVKTIYRIDYWDVCRCDELPPGLALSVFDMCVNAGPGRATRILQQVLGVHADGKIGPITLAAAANTRAPEIYAYANKRMEFYKSLSTFETFGRGWTRRTEETLTEALKLYEANT